jgi:hypothetical protein
MRLSYAEKSDCNTLRQETSMTNFQFGRNVKPHDRHAVCWYHPGVLLLAARDVISSLNQFRNQDERESFTQPLTVIDRSQHSDDDFWFDFIADTGDGGNATYAVARTALADSVPDGLQPPLMRGELLLLGGDLAYPSASSLAYRYRFTEMFEAALPAAEPGPALVRGKPLCLASIPQNHDWMDCASTFGRYFLRNKNSRQFLGAEIPQKQSYFCVRLPQSWWVLGLDFAMTGDIDRDQFEQFASLVSDQGLKTTVNGEEITYRIQPEDRVVIVYPEPIWTTPLAAGVHPGGAKRYQLLEGLLQSRIALRLSGDLHHYMRWTSAQDGQLVTCGTGGAFTHPTHTRVTTSPIVSRCVANTSAIPASTAQILQVGIDDGASPEGVRRFEKVKNSEFPSISSSRRMALGNITALLSAGGTWSDGNRWFALVLGGLYLVSAVLSLFAFGGLLSGLMLAGLCLSMGWESLGEASPKWPPWWGWCFTLSTSLAHALCHLVAVWGLAWGLHTLGVLNEVSLTGMLVWCVAMLVAGSLVGALIFGAYLVSMSWGGWLTNNGYSALALQDFKGFLRFKISPDGQLHGYFIALDHVPKAWTLSKSPLPVWEPSDQLLTSRVHDRFSI